MAVASVTGERVRATRDLLRAADLDRTGLERLLDVAAAMKEHPAGFHRTREGETIACLVADPSARTHVPFAAAAARLGMTPLVLREPRPDAPHPEGVPALSRWVAAIVLATPWQGTADRVAAAADVPVVNARSDRHDPCGALADLLTLRERCGRLDGLHVAFAGDGSSAACHSLVEAGALVGLRLTIACPPARRPADDVLARAAALGAEPHVTADVEGAIAGADVVYAGPPARGTYGISVALMDTAARGAVLLGDPPGPWPAALDRAENRLWTAQAVLHELTEREPL